MRALELEKELKKGVQPGYIITGDDEYLKRFTKESLLATIPKEERLFSYIPIDIGNSEEGGGIGLIIASAETYSMFGATAKKMIDVQPFTREFQIEEKKMLKEYFESPSEDSFVLFEGADKAEDFLMSLCERIDCSKCSDMELYLFVDKKRAKAGYKMDSQDEKKLIKLCSNDFGKVMCELEKLMLYALETKEITTDMLDLLVPLNLDLQVFELTNALSSGENAVAINVLNKLIKKGEKPGGIFLMLLLTYKKIFQIAISQLPDERLQNIFNMTSGALYMNRKIIKQNLAKDPKYITKLKDAVKYLGELEYKYKSYVITDDKALDLAIEYLMAMNAVNNGKK